MVGGVELNSLCELLTGLLLAEHICLARLVDEHGLLKLLGSKQLVAFGFEGVCHGDDGMFWSSRVLATIRERDLGVVKE